MNLSLKKIAEFVGGQCLGCGEKNVTAITTDTREEQKNALFVALRGEKFDGHNFAQNAIESGAVAVLSEKRELSEKLPIIYVKSTYDALLNLAAGYRDMLSPVKRMCNICSF